MIPVVGGIGGSLGYWALLKCRIQAAVVALPDTKSHSTALKITTQVKDLPGTVELLDRAKLHEGYLRRHDGKIHKVRPLKLVKVTKEEDLRKIKAELETWQKKILDCFSDFLSLKEGDLNESQLSKIEEEVARFSAVAAISTFTCGSIDLMLRGISDETLNVIFDEEGDIQAVSVTSSTGRSEDISNLVSAPQNVKSEYSLNSLKSLKKSEGAAAALIAEAAFTSLKSPHGKGVTLSAIDSAKPYYRHLGFQSSDNKNFSLSGDNLIQFLINYGGRISPDKVLNAI